MLILSCNILSVVFFLAQFMSFCNQRLNVSSSLSIIFTPLSYSACCNVTLQHASTNTSENIIVNINNASTRTIPLKIYNSNMESIDLIKYSALNRTLIQTNVLRLPIVLSLCQFDMPVFEIFINNISSGNIKRAIIHALIAFVPFFLEPCLSNHYRCLTNDQHTWCIDEIFHCDGYHSCPQGVDEFTCPSII